MARTWPHRQDESIRIVSYDTGWSGRFAGADGRDRELGDRDPPFEAFTDAKAGFILEALDDRRS